ncbi:Ribonuclease [Pseudomonas sp. IT-232MI5]|jgi:hypothetical protein|uniref:hypothetical protein n=1 Tax=Pseudomonas sp. IT-232MI5 TaxID=3026442 RepID=UPI0039E00234
MANVAGIRETLALSDVERGVIARIQAVNDDIAGHVGNIDFNNPGASASLGFHGIRSAHGIGSFNVSVQNIGFLRTLYPNRGSIGNLYQSNTMNKKKIKLCWLCYSEAAATGHANNQIPTLVEFSGTGGGRLLLEYARDLLFYTPDHYTTYFLVTLDNLPVRTMANW